MRGRGEPALLYKNYTGIIQNALTLYVCTINSKLYSVKQENNALFPDYNREITHTNKVFPDYDRKIWLLNMF